MAPCTKVSSSSPAGTVSRSAFSSRMDNSRAVTTRAAPSMCQNRHVSAFVLLAWVLTCRGISGQISPARRNKMGNWSKKGFASLVAQ